YDPQVGVFRSRFTAAQLTAVAADRTRRWHASPPTAAPTLSREDQYLTEGLWHVRERDRAWNADDPFTAWRENRILEAFFAPVLDTPSYPSLMPARWPVQQRARTAE